jgi:hypothetical protein
MRASNYKKNDLSLLFSSANFDFCFAILDDI